MNIVFKELKVSSNDVKSESCLIKLKSYKIELDFHLGEIKDALENYKVQFQETGVSGNYEWFKKAQKKARLYGLLSQQIQIRIGEVNKVRKTKANQTLGQVFIENSKSILPNDLFYEILDKSLRECPDYDNE